MRRRPFEGEDEGGAKGSAETAGKLWKSELKDVVSRRRAFIRRRPIVSPHNCAGTTNLRAPCLGHRIQSHSQ